ncbi:organic anion transporter 3 [Calliopsis andreniformis]|uniref:organic anion transporter 3 n=1 Tax=Calliopsis andreniformis TaxID=337506 RepID=UPI003FCE96D3
MQAEEVKIGCFQVVIVLLLGVNYVIVAMSHALPFFHNYTPEYHCQVSPLRLKKEFAQNAFYLSLKFHLSFRSCDSEPCLGDYQFATEFGENSVVTEWGLICEKRYLTFLGPTVYYIGVAMGAWIAGLLADRTGRLPVQAICLYTQGTMAVALYAVQNYPAFLALRSLQGVFAQGLQNSTYILSLELFPAKARTYVALIMQIAWAVGLVLLAALSYIIPDWRILQLAVSVPTAITVLYIWIIPESPRWLLAKGKITEAEMAVERITKYNTCCKRLHKEAPAEMETVSENITPIKPERKSRTSCVDLKKSKNDEVKEEATNLLINDANTVEQQKNQNTPPRSVSENLESKVTQPEVPQRNGEPEELNTPSSSRNHRKLKSLSQPLTNRHSKNDVELSSAQKETSKENGEKKSDEEKSSNAHMSLKEELKELFVSRLMRKYGIVMVCQWLSCSVAYHVFLTLVPNFPIDRHVNFALGGALEIAAYVFIYFVLSRYGRRIPMSVYQSLNGFICILTVAAMVLSNPTFGSDLTKTILLLFGRVTVISTISIAYLYTIEIFPTVGRGTCLGICTIFAKIGSLCTPHFLLSGKYFPVTIPVIIIGMLCLVSGGLALILPETMNKVLPDTVEDSELLIVKRREKRNNLITESTLTNEDLCEREILREKLFSEDWVDAGNGILVNFTENKNSE